MKQNMAIDFVLVEPAYPSNIGSAARALKCMGFTQLKLINPKRDHLNERAIRLATHGEDVLRSATVLNSLDDIIGDYDLVVATSNKPRNSTLPFLNIYQLAEFVHEREDSLSKIAFVFGPERTGLPNSLINKAHVVSYIPTSHPAYSLNLAQAVMIYAFHFATQSNGKKTKAQKKINKAPTKEELEFLKKQLKGVIAKLNMANMGLDSETQSSLMQRLDLIKLIDLHLIHGFLKKLDRLMPP